MSIRAIITGSTGMIGEGVLHECLNHPDVESVLVINRKTCGVDHPKLKEIIHPDFSDFSVIEKDFEGYNTAYLNMGVSSAGMSEEKYKHLTYDLTMALAKSLYRANPELTICYVTGAGTDSSETGRTMWARVKGKTENDLLQMGFSKAFMFRPALITPWPGLKNTNKLYVFAKPLLPLFRRFFPRYVCSLREIAQAMIQVTVQGSDKHILEVPDIIALAALHSKTGAQ